MNEEGLEIQEQDEPSSKSVVHPKKLIPKELEIDSNENEEAQKQKFNEYYLKLMTSGFGEDLNALRESKDFNADSMPIIIQSLKEGVNMFDKEQRDIILSSLPSK